MSGLLVDVWPREPTFPAESLDPAVWLEGTKLYRVGEDGASTGNPVPPQEALRR
jgi:hypothetical protein